MTNDEAIVWSRRTFLVEPAQLEDWNVKNLESNSNGGQSIEQKEERVRLQIHSYFLAIHEQWWGNCSKQEAPASRNRVTRGLPEM